MPDIAIIVDNSYYSESDSQLINGCEYEYFKPKAINGKMYDVTIYECASVSIYDLKEHLILGFIISDEKPANWMLKLIETLKNDSLFTGEMIIFSRPYFGRKVPFDQKLLQEKIISELSECEKIRNDQGKHTYITDFPSLSTVDEKIDHLLTEIDSRYRDFK